MNKRITSLVLCFLMVLTMLATAVPAFAAGTTVITITPDKTTAAPGDTITYTVKLGPVQNFNSLNFTLVIPTGLTYVSGAEVTGLATTLGANTAAYTDSTKTMVVYGGGAYSNTSDTTLMTFSCTVAADAAAGDYKIGLDGDEFVGDSPDGISEITTTWNLDASKVTVAEAEEHSHSYGTDWESDENNHWHACACGAKTDVAAHSSRWVTDTEPTTESVGYQHEECSICLRVLASRVEIPMLEPNSWTISVPVTKIVTKSDEAGTPPKAIISFEIMLPYVLEDADLSGISIGTLETKSGIGKTETNIEIRGTNLDTYGLLFDGFFFREKNIDNSSWDYSDEAYMIYPNNDDNSVTIYPTTQVEVGTTPASNSNSNSLPYIVNYEEEVERASFTNTYIGSGSDDDDDDDDDEVEDIVPPKQSPDTGDNSNMGLWIALAGISLFSMVAILFGKKRLFSRSR